MHHAGSCQWGVSVLISLNVRFFVPRSSWNSCRMRSVFKASCDDERRANIRCVRAQQHDIVIRDLVHELASNTRKISKPLVGYKSFMGRADRQTPQRPNTSWNEKTARTLFNLSLITTLLFCICVMQSQKSATYSDLARSHQKLGLSYVPERMLDQVANKSRWHPVSAK